MAKWSRKRNECFPALFAKAQRSYAGRGSYGIAGYETMNQTTAVLFDLDGTLLNSLEDLADSANFALRAMDRPQHSLEEYRYYVGNGVRNLMRRALSGRLDPIPQSDEPAAPLVEEALQRFKAHYEINKTNKTKPYDGVFELLSQLKERGFRTAVISNKYDGAVRELADLYFSGLLDEAIGESQKVRKKPAPDGINEVLARFGYQKEDAIYVGDSDVDVQTAKNAGMFCVGAAWGFRGRQELLQAGADAVIERPEQLWQHLPRIPKEGV